jgi:ketosteroid isomerase-like protein
MKLAQKVIHAVWMLQGVLLVSACQERTDSQSVAFSNNKRTVQRYMEAFNQGDHPKIIACLTDDVTWELPGVYLHKGKDAFDKEIENDNFTGKPLIKVSRLTEQNNIVIAEGTVQARKKDGTLMNIVFCDVFEMQDGLIKKLTSYLMSREGGD